MWLVLNIGSYVFADILARSAPQALEITSVIVVAGRGPPETDHVGVIAEFLAGEKIVCFQQRLGSLELFISEVIFVVEVRNLLINSAQRGLCLIRCCLGDQIDWSDISLRVIAKINRSYQASIDQIALESRIRLTKDK